MHKFIFTLFCMMLVSHNVFAIQIIHQSSKNRSSEETAELNRKEEKQELLRKQVEIQEQTLRLQQRQQLQNSYYRR